MATNKRLIKSNDEGGGGASFNTVLYPGNSGVNPITDVGFQPDLVWIKSKNINGANHNIYDSVRGAGKALFSNATLNEYTTTEMVGFSSDGFNFTGTAFDSNNVGNNYVAWCWKAAGYANTFNVLENGSTTSSATAAGVGLGTGTNLSTFSVSANRDAGFSVVSYTPSSSPQTVPHGLTTKPSMVMTKSRNAIGPWYCLTDLIDGSVDWLFLNTTGEKVDSSDTLTSTNFSTAYGSTTNLIAYCFAEVPGFSKFGSYSGGSTGSGAEISVGFEPAFVMIKKTDGVSGLAHWWIWDNKRNPSSPYGLQPDLSNAEATDDLIRFTSTGFYFVSTSGEINNSGSNFIYMAFANQF